MAVRFHIAELEHEPKGGVDKIHGGFGFAEEYTVSRLFVDARVLSIFEGADETLCLKLIARRLLADAR